MQSPSLTKYAWLSIGAAVLTIGLKSFAYILTGSVGLLSDALESLVNLLAAVIALWMLKIAELPPDAEHAYGHNKAEYFSSILEGLFILIAAGGIAYTAIERLLHPQPVEQAFLGLSVSVIASLINAATAYQLLRVGKKFESITLEADAHHLLTDVWTSIGVLIGVAAVALTGWNSLDPIIALLVALNIVWTGYTLMKRSVMGFMDTAIEPADLKKITSILDKYCKHGIQYHAIRTRQSATRRFVTLHLLVPGDWSVKKGHDMVDKLEEEICHAISHITVLTHMEPLEDPTSFNDISIDRK